MCTSNSSGTKTNLKGCNVRDDDGQNSFEEHTKVSHSVDQLLLRERKSSCLAQQIVTPLRSNNTNKVGPLSIMESFCSIANLCVCDLGVSPESWNRIVGWIPSAWWPTSSVFENVEKSDIKVGSKRRIPEKSISVFFMSVVGVSEVWFMSMVNICVFGIVPFFLDNEDDCAWFHSIVIHDIEISEPSSKCLNKSSLHISESKKSMAYQMITFRIPRFPFHNIKFGVFISKGDSR